MMDKNKSKGKQVTCTMLFMSEVKEVGDKSSAVIVWVFPLKYTATEFSEFQQKQISVPFHLFCSMQIKDVHFNNLMKTTELRLFEISDRS